MGVPKSALREVYWSHTFEDLKQIVGLRTSYETATVYQTYESLMLVASKVFGSEKPKAKAKPAETYADLENFINGL